MFCLKPSKNLIMFINVILLFIGYSTGVDTYNYEDLGPDSWPLDTPQCGGQRQSPINIKKSLLVYEPTLKPIVFTGHNTNINYTATNSQRNLNFASSNNLITIGGSNFDTNYVLKSFHIHWGENNYQGSEHTIEGTKYPLEIHFVHSTSSGRLAVLGFLFELSDSDNPGLTPILDVISKAENETFSAMLSVNLFSILPVNRDLNNYFRYIGSLTTPPCTEGVIWTIFDDHIPISQKQMQVFHQNKISKNFRPPQRLYSRSVFSSMKIVPDFKYDLIHLNNSNKQSLNFWFLVIAVTSISYIFNKFSF